MNWVKNYVPLGITLVALAAAIYGILYGSPSLYFASGIVAALALFWMRKRYRIFYGVIEVMVGLATLQQAARIGKGGFSSDFSADFQTFQWKLALLATLAAVYIVVRGLDNIEQGWRNRKTTNL
jgi:hypothetical protein